MNEYKDKYTHVILGDARELIKDVEPESIDLIFTDPPYLKKYLPLYKWVGKEAARVLKPDGFLMAYCGGCWKNITMRMLDQELDFYWDFTQYMPGQNSIIWHKKIIAKNKNILCYRKKGSGALPRCNVLGAWQGGCKDKRFHFWGQDEQTARYYIDCFSSPKEIILEPFTGGGTTPFVCKKLKRYCLAFEIEQDAFKQTVERLGNMPTMTEYKQLQLLGEKVL